MKINRYGLRDPVLNIPYEVSNYVEWKGTPGVGDFMMGLNCCHLIAQLIKEPVYMDIHWYHSQDYLFHCEDPETIIERFQYIHKFYKNYDQVKVNHIFQSNDMDLFEARYRGFLRTDKSRGQPPKGLTSWVFNDTIRSVKTDENKIVIWKPFLNATPAPEWKKSISSGNWNMITDWYLTQKHKYQIVELSYRTPIREVMYHMSTCHAVVAYEGMWHYFARNLLKPTVIIGNNSIHLCHDPQAVPLMKPGKDNSNIVSIFKHKDIFNSKINKALDEYKSKLIGIL